jgi:hypothetical protein
LILPPLGMDRGIMGGIIITPLLLRGVGVGKERYKGRTGVRGRRREGEGCLREKERERKKDRDNAR